MRVIELVLYHGNNKAALTYSRVIIGHYFTLSESKADSGDGYIFSSSSAPSPLSRKMTSYFSPSFFRRSLKLGMLVCLVTVSILGNNNLIRLKACLDQLLSISMSQPFPEGTVPNSVVRDELCHSKQTDGNGSLPMLATSCVREDGSRDLRVYISGELLFSITVEQFPNFSRWLGTCLHNHRCPVTAPTGSLVNWCHSQSTLSGQSDIKICFPGGGSRAKLVVEALLLDDRETAMIFAVVTSQ